MRAALAAAEEAGANGEVPIGAMLVSVGGELLASAGNRTRIDCDPTGHAEIIALRLAARATGNYRLTGATMYATIEPCAMCAGALIQARISRLVYGAPDERAGAIHSVFRICDEAALNHRIAITGGVLEGECRLLMQRFFQARRKNKIESKNADGESANVSLP